MSEYSSGGNWMPASHQPQKRQYQPCTKCGNPTFATAGVCTRCTGAHAKKRVYILRSRREQCKTRGLARAMLMIELLENSTLNMIEIADHCDCHPSTVRALRNGRTWRNVTGGHVARPWEDEL